MPGLSDTPGGRSHVAEWGSATIRGLQTSCPRQALHGIGGKPSTDVRARAQESASTSDVLDMSPSLTVPRGAQPVEPRFDAREQPERTERPQQPRPADFAPAWLPEFAPLR